MGDAKYPMGVKNILGYLEWRYKISYGVKNILGLLEWGCKISYVGEDYPRIFGMGGQISWGASDTGCPLFEVERCPLLCTISMGFSTVQRLSAYRRDHY